MQRIAATNGLYQRVGHRESWRNLLTQRAVIGETLTRDERQIFQAFLLIGLLACGAQVLVTRL